MQLLMQLLISRLSATVDGGATRWVAAGSGGGSGGVAMTADTIDM